jgi:hypothetical protein
MLFLFHASLSSRPARPRGAQFRPQLETFESRDLPSVFGTNLIVNGNAESGAASAKGYDVIRPIPGWNPSGNFTVVKYGAPAFPTGLSHGGNNFFAGGPSNPRSQATQTITIPASDGALIDRGSVTFNLSGALGGWSSQGDNAVLTAQFEDSQGHTLGTGKIGPVTAAQRNSTTELLPRSVGGAVPAGTRSILIDLVMTRQAGSYNDGYADNLSLVLSTTRSTVYFAAAQYSALETRGTITVTIARDGNVGAAASFHLASSNGTATAGLDYTAVNTTLTFTAGQTTKTFKVAIKDDMVKEPNESFFLTLSRPGTNVVLGAPSKTTLTILNDD